MFLLITYYAEYLTNQIATYNNLTAEAFSFPVLVAITYLYVNYTHYFNQKYS